MKQNIKLIATDMDGTLLNSQKEISLQTKQALEEVIAKGIHVVPATGRTKLGLPDELLEMKGLRYGIYCNGAIVYDHLEEKVIGSNYMDSAVVLKLLEFADQYDVMCDVYIEGYGHCERRCFDNLLYYNIDYKLVDLVIKTRKPVENLIEFVKMSQKPIEKMNIFFHNLEERNIALEAFKKLGICNVTSSLYNNVELNHSSCNKGNALLQLSEHLGFVRSEIMAFGDASNDYEMIKLAGLGIAMDNGMDEVKEIADAVTRSNDEDGVAYAIEKYIL